MCSGWTWRVPRAGRRRGVRATNGTSGYLSQVFIDGSSFSGHTCDGLCYKGWRYWAGREGSTRASGRGRLACLAGKVAARFCQACRARSLFSLLGVRLSSPSNHLGPPHSPPQRFATALSFLLSGYVQNRWRLTWRAYLLVLAARCLADLAKAVGPSIVGHKLKEKLIMGHAGSVDFATVGP